jgi:hypothetical protein
MRPETAPHSGQVAIFVLGLAITMIFAPLISTPSTARPAGVSVAVWLLRHIFGDSPKRLNQPLCHPRHADRCTKSESEPILHAD